MLLLLAFLGAVVALPADSILPEAPDTSTDQAVETVTKLVNTPSFEQRTAVLASLGSTSQASRTDNNKYDEIMDEMSTVKHYKHKRKQERKPNDWKSNAKKAAQVCEDQCLAMVPDGHLHWRFTKSPYCRIARMACSPEGYRNTFGSKFAIRRGSSALQECWKEHIHHFDRKKVLASKDDKKEVKVTADYLNFKRKRQGQMCEDKCLAMVPDDQSVYCRAAKMA